MLLQWASNDNNLYAAALAVCNITTFPKWKISLVMGILSSCVAEFGIYGYFNSFLSMLGTFIPPVGGIIMVDFYIFNKDKQSNLYVEDSTIKDYNITGIFSFLFAGLLTFILSKLGYNLIVDALFSMLLVALLYYFISIAKMTKQ